MKGAREVDNSVVGSMAIGACRVIGSLCKSDGQSNWYAFIKLLSSFDSNL